MLRIYLPILLISFTLVACGDEKKPEAEPRTRSGMLPPDAKKPEPVEAPHTPVPQGPSTPGSTNMETGQVDTTDGTLTVNGSGAIKGTWTFHDVSAQLDEKSGGGTTTGTLSVEAHDGPANLHFRIRLRNEGGAIAAGSYTIDGKQRKLDARWESGRLMFNSVFGGDGTVELTSIGNGRVVGRFDLTLNSADKQGEPQTITGRFNQALIK